MRPAALLCLIAVSLGLSPVSTADDKTAAAPVEAGRHDVVFFGAHGPVFVRIQVMFGDLSLEEVWAQSANEMFAYLDVDDSGALSPSELAHFQRQENGRVTTQRTSVIRTFLRQFVPPSGEKPKEPDETDSTAFQEVYRTKHDPFRLQVARNVTPVGISIFDRADRDKDGTLSMDELRGLGSSLRQLDLNGDEAISVRELLQFQNPFSQAANNALTDPSAWPASTIVQLGDMPTMTTLVTSLLNRYGTDGSEGIARGLAREKLLMDDVHWQQHDENGDGSLHSEELLALLQAPVPDLELRVQLGKTNTDDPDIQVASPLPGSSVDLRQLEGPGAVVDLAGTRMNLDALSQQSFDVIQFLDQQFTLADGDKNKYLEKDEVEGNYYLSRLYDDMDRDRDEKLYREEVTEYLKRLSASASARAELQVVDNGQQFFHFLDSDGDGRLSQRELGNAADSATTWDRNQDGKLAADEIPPSFALSFGRGSVQQIAGVFFSTPQVQTTRIRPPRKTEGPRWFVGLDRNQDGDLSPNEFTGPIEIFKKLDTNGDGLISLEEAR